MPRVGKAESSATRVVFSALFLLAILVGVYPWASAQNPAVVGQFSPLMNWPYNAVHAVLLPSGKVMWWPSFSAGDKPYIWDPIANTNTPATPAGYNIFCAGHALTEAGQVFVTGGDSAISTGVANASMYDPVGATWTFLPNMNAGRWYPTNTVLANGDILVTSGEISPQLGNDPLPEVWQVASGTWRDLTTAQLTLPLYPEMYLAPNGSIFYAGPGSPSRYLNTNGTGSWTIGPTMNFPNRGYGPSVMYDNGKILIMGGGPPTATAEIINLNDPVPTWHYTASMANARRQDNATLLPDGTVLVTGGTTSALFDDPTQPVFPSELWNPTTGTWSTLASLSTYRGYHSIALLLPDGRVLSAGDECTNAQGCDKASAEVFSPPYLFAGPRPTITSAPTNINGGSTFFVGTPDAANITQVSLIRFGSVTHTFNQEQRISFLSFSQATGGLNVTAPQNANLAPPGYYMLFLLNNGVPSVASIIQIDNSSFTATQSQMSLSQTALAFPITWVGSTSTTKSVQLTNLGTSPVTISSITTGADYTVISNTCGTQLAPGSCTINVAFKPTASGSLNESLTINDSDLDSPQTVSLTGNARALKASVGTLNFPNQAIGVTSKPIPVILTNLGTSPISVTSINYSNPEFSQSSAASTCGASIPGSSSCQIASVFTPNAPSTQTGTLSVVDSDPGSPTVVNLSGVGLTLSFSPTYLSFGNQAIPKTTNPATLTVTNAGPVAVNFSSIVVGGTNPGDFAIQTNTCGTSVGANSNCKLGVTFTPQVAGARSANVTFTDDGGGSPQIVTLAGHGVPVLSSISVTPANFSVAIGGTQQFTATGNYSDGSTNNVTASATWSSSKTSVATISNTSGSQGLATTAAQGATTISAAVGFVKGTTTLTVQANTTTALASNNNPSTFGQAVTFMATVSPSTATGTVQFFDGGSLIGSSSLTNGAASFTTTSLASGTHNITAVYSGDANDTTSTSAPLVQTVN